MIYRKWSMFTSTLAVFGGVVGATVVAHVLFVDDPFLLKPKKSADSPPSTK